MGPEASNSNDAGTFFRYLPHGESAPEPYNRGIAGAFPRHNAVAAGIHASRK
jgi:hypothetical protein